MLKPSFLLPVLAASLVLAFAPESAASDDKPSCADLYGSDCPADLDEGGACHSVHELKWCDADGKVRCAACPPGEICAKHLPNDSGYVYLCLEAAQTYCKDIPRDGMCTSDNNVVWCVDGMVELLECQYDEVCRTDAYGAADCEPKNASIGTDTHPGQDAAFAGADASDSPPEPDPGPSADAGVMREEEPSPGGPSPQVEPGGPWATLGGGGCASASELGWPWLAAFVLLLLGATRRE